MFYCLSNYYEIINNYHIDWVNDLHCLHAERDTIRCKLDLLRF